MTYYPASMQRFSSPGLRPAWILRWAAAVGAVAIALSSHLGCSQPLDQKPNILFIVIDTLRADRLGAYGNADGLSPFIDSLADRGVVFENAYAPSSWTGPSVASLLTSMFPSQHRVVTLESVLSRNAVTLPELLADVGYTTSGFVTNPSLNPKMGFAQGYDSYVTFPYTTVPPDETGLYLAPATRAPTVNRRFLRWLDAHPTSDGPPLFIYLHYMEPHTPYGPTPALLEEFFAGREKPDVNRANAHTLLNESVPSDVLHDIRALYDLEVVAMDRALRDLFGELERRGILDELLVVLTSDHGEGLNDHGFLTHGATLFNEEIRVPLIFVMPGKTIGARASEAVSLVDVAPTLLDVLGVKAPSSFEGRSFRDHLEGGSWWSQLRAALQSAPSGLAVSELLAAPFGGEKKSQHQRAVIAGMHKVVVRDDGGKEFYDLEADPREIDARALEDSDRQRLAQEAAGFAERYVANADSAPAETVELDAKTQEALRALGYLDE